MDKQAYIDEIRMQLSGGLLELEIDNVTINKVLDASLREIQRYIDTTELITVPYKNVIDMNTVNDGKVNAVARVYRAQGYYSTSGESTGTSAVDPLYASQWQLLSGTNSMNNFSNFSLNFASWNTMLQIRNTLSTDLIFKYDRSSNKLYINVATGTPTEITIEYVPRYDDISEIKSDFWIDILMRMSVAQCKILLGRIRSRYTQSNALWTHDGSTILEEGKSELQDLREKLNQSTQLCYPID